MKTLIILTIACLIALPAFALDGSISAELDGTKNGQHGATDYQGNIGQVIGQFRPYMSFEHTHESVYFPNSNKNYRVGMEYNPLSFLKVEFGSGFYKSTTFGYGKLTISFDTGAK